MNYRGHVQNGVVVLDGPAKLPDGTEVQVLPVKPPASARRATRKGQKPRTVADRLRPLIGCLKGLPSDLAENHDHYLYGVPKRKRE